MATEESQGGGGGGGGGGAYIYKETKQALSESRAVLMRLGC